MKKISRYYLDFETTNIEIPKDTYYWKNKGDKEKTKITNYFDLIKSGIPYIPPKVYSWGVAYNIKEKNFSDDQLLIHEDKQAKFNYGIDINEFVEKLQSLKTDTEFWTNNGKGFDFHYLIPALENNGYKPFVKFDIAEIDDKNVDAYTFFKNLWDERWDKKLKLINDNKHLKELPQEQKDAIIKKQWNTLLPYEYKMSVNQNNHIYNIDIGLSSIKKSKAKSEYRKCSFRDNLLLFPSSIKKMGEIISKHYQKFYEFDKAKADNWFHKKQLSSNYTKTESYETIQELEEDGNELEYLFTDCFILLKWLELMEEYIPRTKWKLTIGATSYAYWESMIGKSLIESQIQRGEIRVYSHNANFKSYIYRERIYKEKKMGELLLKQLLPTDWLDQQCPYDKTITHHQFIFTKFYTGGMTQVNEEYRGRYIKGATFVDITSSYPTQMDSQQFIPYGTPVFKKTKGYDYGLYRVDIKKKVSTNNSLPFIFDTRNIKREYLKELKKGAILYLNEIKLKAFKKYYNVKDEDIVVKPLYYFKSIPATAVFNEYITYWFNIKKQAKKDGNEILESIAKLFLNSLYGKFGTKKLLVTKHWLFQQWFTETVIQKSKYFLPIADAITTMGALYVVDGCGNLYHLFIYMDTDSMLVYKWKKFNLTIGKELGQWGIEKDTHNWNGVVRRAKQYYLVDPTKQVLDKDTGKMVPLKKVAFAGINYNKYLFDDEELETYNENVKIIEDLTIKDFVFGKEIPHQTKPVRILGHGVVIDSVVKQIKPIWDKSNKPLTQQKHITKEDYLKLYEQFPK